MSARYQLTRLIEAGELANLYGAERSDGVAVVVKLFHPKTTDLAYAQKFAELSRRVRTLPEGLVAHTLDLGLVNRQLAVVREDVDGVSLGQVLRRLNSKEVAIVPPLALGLVIEIADALERAHGAEVLHGALTPGNVLLASAGFLSLCDFGVLRAIDAAPGLRKVFGSTGRNNYRAPEVTRGEPSTVSSDVYSLGAIAYELLTLKEPVQERAGQSVSRGKSGLPAPSRIERRLNARIDPIILRALDANPQRRFRSANELAQGIRNFLSASGGLPGAADVRKLVLEVKALVPAVNVESLPLQGQFELAPIEGAQLVASGERSGFFTSRPPFSGGEVAVQEHSESSNPSLASIPPRSGEGSDGRGDPPRRSGAGVRAAAARTFEEPESEVGTHPGAAGPLERGWDAPPGAQPPKPRRSKGEGFSGELMPPKNPRLKVVEDFGAADSKRPAPPSAPLGLLPTETVLEQPSMPGPSTTSEMEAAQAPAPQTPPPVAIAKASTTSDYVARMVSGIGQKDGDAERRAAEERQASEQHSRRRLLRFLAFVVAALGVAGLVLFVWLVNQREPEPSAPPSIPIAAPIAPTPLPKPPSTPGVEYDNPPPRAHAGFLSIRTNVPAFVYLDSLRVRGATPLAAYPVRPGHHLVKLEAKGTGDTTEFPITVLRGKAQAVDETGLAKRPHR